MDIVHMFLNMVVPPTGLTLLALILPLLLMLRFFRRLLRDMFRENMRGKVVLITGASSGIGEELAYEYALQGAKLVLVARREKLLNEVAARVRFLGAMDVHVYPVDVSREEGCKKLVEDTIRRFGYVHHLVNNAGISHNFMFEEAKYTRVFHPIVDTTFWGSVYLTYHALPHLRHSRGRIVVISSVAAWLPLPRMSIYNAAKAAVTQFFETLRVEVSPDVGVTIVAPGFVDTEMTEGRVLTAEGELEYKPDLRDRIQAGPWPFASAQYCARAILEGATRGERCVVVPKWYQAFFYYRVVVPELLDWLNRALYLDDLHVRDLAWKV